MSVQASLALFDPTTDQLSDGATLLRGFVRDAAALLAAVAEVATASPFRHLVVPGGHTMSVAMTNCGALGWVSDRAGYRYSPLDPSTGLAWPPMPDAFAALADAAALAAGFAPFAPEACLVNRYVPGARLSLHVDRDERSGDVPIVSVSLGLPATFLWGGLARGDPARRVRLEHGDVVVFGGPSRRVFHGVAPLPKGSHPSTGECRINLTFRRARPLP